MFGLGMHVEDCVPSQEPYLSCFKGKIHGPVGVQIKPVFKFKAVDKMNISLIY